MSRKKVGWAAAGVMAIAALIGWFRPQPDFDRHLDPESDPLPLGERHLCWILGEFVVHYHGERKSPRAWPRADRALTIAASKGRLRRRQRIGGPYGRLLALQDHPIMDRRFERMAQRCNVIERGGGKA